MEIWRGTCWLEATASRGNTRRGYQIDRGCRLLCLLNALLSTRFQVDDCELPPHARMYGTSRWCVVVADAGGGVGDRRGLREHRPERTRGERLLLPARRDPPGIPSARVRIRTRARGPSGTRGGLERRRGGPGRLDVDADHHDDHRGPDDVDEVKEASEAEEAGAARQPGAGAGGV